MVLCSDSADVKDPNDLGVVVVVDLDGTLCRTDTLHEALLRVFARTPHKLLSLPRWLTRGRAEVKAKIAELLVLDSSSLPLNEEVVSEVCRARQAGQKTALVSAADHRQVARIAEDVGIFDEAYGSTEGQNLGGTEKARFLVEKYGEKEFDYYGDSEADIPVWSSARRSYTVRAKPHVCRAAEAANPLTQHIDRRSRRWPFAVKALRPHQWSKNILVFLPMLAAHDLTHFGSVVLAFLAFCCTASAAYVINDLLDMPSDRKHPRKRKRPFAAGDLSTRFGLMMVAFLLFVSLVLSSMIQEAWVLVVIFLYLMASCLYSLWLKRKLLVDVLALAGLYTVRIIAGGFAASVVLSPWLLGFSMFLFLALAAVKRQAELTDQVLTGRSSTGRAYQVDDLPVLRGIALSAGNAAVLVLALYISSDDVQALYSRPELIWLVCPLLLYWTTRMVMKTHRGEMTDDPIVYAATDRTSLIVVSACIFFTVLSI